MNPLIRFPDKAIVMPLRLFGSVEYYAAMSAFGTVYIDDTTRFDKRQKAVHRYSIIDTQGPLDLTVPIAKPKVSPKAPIDLATPNVVEEGRKATWRDIALSSHGNWQHVHDVSLASPYGRTPFYEFYADRLKSFFAEDVVYSFESIADYDLAADSLVRIILGFENRVIPLSVAAKDHHLSKTAGEHHHSAVAEEYLKLAETSSNDVSSHLDDVVGLPIRYNGIPSIKSSGTLISKNIPSVNVSEIIDSKDTAKLISEIMPLEYYQVRSARFGFAGRLSILDLIFNLGPEAPLHLHRLTSKLKTE